MEGLLRRQGTRRIEERLEEQNVLKEALRVLKPGGKFLCLEFSKVDDTTISKLLTVSKPAAKEIKNN